MTAPEPLLFVSHVSENRSAAMEVVAELERRGVRCWIAPRDVTPGKPFDNEIAAAIDASRAMLLIFSEHCNTSEYIRREVTVAGESQKVIIPFRIENAQPKHGLRVRLSDLHWIDGFVSQERAIDELVKTFPRAKPEALPAAAAELALRERAPRPAGKPAADETRDRAEARPVSPRSRVALLIAALIGAAALGAAGVWFALAPRPQATTASDRPAPVRDPRALPCAQEGQIKSIDGKQPTAMTFLNESGSPVRQYWLDYAGQRKLYSTIKPGESHTQQTFLTHPWLITDAADKCIAIYLPDGSGNTVIIH